MRISQVMSLIGAAGMAAALMVGCGDNDAKPASSQVGQSCVRTADCADGLSCISNVCYKTAPPTGGEAGDSSTPAPVPPVLGSEGESCTSRLDCANKLGCFNNRCTTAPSTGDAGASGMALQLGSRGESCRVNGDCEKSLICVPSSAIAGTGICDLESSGFKPTGMTCGGECLADSDCYQFPISLHTADIKSCEDIADAIAAGPIDCAATVIPAEKTLCFEQATYCGFTAKSKTWTCDTDTNSCVYNTACVVAAGEDVPTGCPSFSRIRTLVALAVGLTCNPDSKKCVGPTTTVKSCTTDAKCEGEQVTDGTIGDLCTAGECTCYAGNKQCYRKCARDIDCGAGKSCDAKIKLCVPSGACDTDAQCAVAGQSLAWMCNSGTCAQACSNDRECSPSGISGPGNGGAFNGKVCGADGFCASVVGECTAETQCPLAAGGLKTFCVAKPAMAGVTVSSAITD